jgi:hypothetical protein
MSGGFRGRAIPGVNAGAVVPAPSIGAPGTRRASRAGQRGLGLAGRPPPAPAGSRTRGAGPGRGGADWGSLRVGVSYNLT